MTTPPEHPDVDCEDLADAMPPVGGAPSAAPPPPPTRAARLLHAGERLFIRADAYLERHAPHALNPLAQLGPCANVALVLAVASGILLLIWYSPSVQSAWTSLAGLGPHSLGGLMRSIHRYSSDLLMLLVLAHAARALAARKFADARWLAWTSGLALLALTWFIGWTGYWLPWDVRAQLVAVDTMKAVDVLPVFGEPMLRLFTSDRTVPSLLFFVVFFLHLLLPLAIAGGLCVHLARLSRAKLFPDWHLSAWLTAAVFAAAVLYPAANAAPAHLALKPARFTMDWWFLWPLALSGRLTGGGIWVAALLGAAGLFTVPWWLARRRPRPAFQATVNVSRCFSCTSCTKDCPFDAITMVPRTDGKPFPSQARIDPARCIGCGVCSGACDTQAIGLPWFDARQTIQRLEATLLAARERGVYPAFALVCAQSNGGWDLFERARWAARLPGYIVEPVPCVGWIEPKLLERLVSKGAAAVLIVGCGSADPSCREGKRWLAARLDGQREPAFRPSRADRSKILQVSYDLTRPQLVTAAAASLLANIPLPHAAKPVRWRGWLAGGLATIATVTALLLISDAPFKNPASSTPEFIFTFREFGDWVSGPAAATPAAADTRPIHMRGALPQQRARSNVVVWLTIDGQERTAAFRPKGVTSDGQSVGEIRVPLSPGRHTITVSLATRAAPDAPRHTWTQEITAELQRLIVLSYDPATGFTLD